MVGRTPEYLGKKIEAYEMKMASLVILIPAVRGARRDRDRRASPRPAAGASCNPGAHGFSEMLYAFSSAANNNGCAFGGITVSGTFYTTALGVCMLIGRYWVIVPVLAIAGALAKKKSSRPARGTLPTHTPLFVACWWARSLLVGALTFIPALALGADRRALSQLWASERTLIMSQATHVTPAKPSVRSTRIVRTGCRSTRSRSSIRGA